MLIDAKHWVTSDSPAVIPAVGQGLEAVQPGRRLVPPGPAILTRISVRPALMPPQVDRWVWVWTAIAVALITGLGAVVRLFYLLEHPMRYDEAYNYLHFASKSPVYIATHYLPNNHVLHTLMVRASSAILGSSPAALRVPAFVGGVALMPAAAWLAWILARNRLACVLSALAAAASSPLIEYSANARGYSWLALLATMTTGLAIGLLNTPSIRRWIIWAVVAALGTYTVPVMAYVLAGQIAAMSSLSVLRRMGGAQRNALHESEGKSTGIFGCALGTAVWLGLSALLYAPILCVEGTSGFRRGTAMAYRIHGDDLGSFSHMLTRTWELWSRHTGPAWQSVFMIGLILFVGSTVLRRRPERLVPIFVLAGSVFFVSLMAAPLPPRAWLFGLPIALACGLAGWVDAVPSRLLVTRAMRLTRTVAVTLLLGWPLVEASRSARLVAEPGGLVEVREAVQACRLWDPARCAVVSRYSPATAYYASMMNLGTLALPDSAATERVLIVADALKSVEDLWNPKAPGFDGFATAEKLILLPGATVYCADQANHAVGKAEAPADH